MYRLFNNGASEYDQDFPYSQGLLINFDEASRTVTLNNARSPFNRTVTTAQGSVQLLENGDSFVGYVFPSSFAIISRSNVPYLEPSAGARCHTFPNTMHLGTLYGLPNLPPARTRSQLTAYSCTTGSPDRLPHPPCLSPVPPTQPMRSSMLGGMAQLK